MLLYGCLSNFIKIHKAVAGIIVNKCTFFCAAKHAKFIWIITVGAKIKS